MSQSSAIAATNQDTSRQIALNLNFGFVLVVLLDMIFGIVLWNLRKLLVVSGVLKMTTSSTSADSLGKVDKM
jgi:hypothetical protein